MVKSQLQYNYVFSLRKQLKVIVKDYYIIFNVNSLFS